MSRVLILVEGQTEQTFVEEVLAPALGLKGIEVRPKVIGKPGHKGGVGEWQRAKREIMALLKQSRNSFCTTMFDYYGMPDSWPGRTSARFVPPSQRASRVEAAIHEEVSAEMGESFDARRFIPYLEMHEFEAMLFSDCSALAEAVGRPDMNCEFQKIADEFGSPEEIDDDPMDAPSKRIEKVIPGFRKRHTGNLAARKMGLPCIRTKCPHFDQWVRKLEAIGS
jgi:hypothetical protein